MVMSAAYKFDALLPPFARQVGATSMRTAVEAMAGSHFVDSNRRLAKIVSWEPEQFGYMT
jgi:hypothetical protein